MFHHFEGLIHRCRKTLGRDFDKNKIRDYLFEALPRLPNQDALLALLEYVHYTQTHKVYYVSRQMAEAFMHTDFKIDFDHVLLPLPLFEVCMDFKIYKDYQAPGVLVFTPNDTILRESMEKLVNVKVNIKFDDTFGIKYSSAVDPTGICHETINMGDKKKISEIIKDHMTTKPLQSTVPLNNDEIIIQERLLNIVFGVICYLNVVDPDIVKYKDRNRPALGSIAPKSEILGNVIFKFIRQGHWRFLVHPKWKKRFQFVWVRAHQVGNIVSYREPKVEEIK